MRLWDASSRSAKVLAVFDHDSAGTPSSSVNGAVFSIDGTRVLTTSPNDEELGRARLWDARSGKIVANLGIRVNSAAFSPDGTRIVTAGGNTARVWDASGKELVTLKGHNSEVNSASFSSDGTRIVTASGRARQSHDNTARVWEAGSGRELAVLSGHKSTVNSAEFSPDGTRIVTASDDKTARLWDNTGQELFAFDHNSRVDRAAFRPDGKRIVTVFVFTGDSRSFLIDKKRTRTGDGPATKS